MKKPECDMTNNCVTRFTQYKYCFMYTKELESCKDCKLYKIYEKRLKEYKENNNGR
jgi:hypothetical protein